MDATRIDTSGRTTKLPPALTVLLVGAVLYFARDVLIPVALAVLLAFLLAPLVRRLERYRVPRIAAVVAAVGMTCVVLGGLGWIVQARALELAGKLPEYKENIRVKLAALRPEGVLDRAEAALKELEEEISAPAKTEEPESGAPVEPVEVRVVEGPAPPLSYARSLLGPVMSRVATAGIVLVFVVFILLKREDLRNRLLWLIGERSMPLATPALDDAAQRVSRYLLMQTLANTLAGVAVGLGLWAVGIPTPGVWGLLVAVLRFIPYVGVLLATALPLGLSVAVSPGWSEPLMVIGIIGGVEVIVGNVVEPLLYGSKTGLSPLAILVAAIFWAWLWGPVGLLLSTPLTVCLAVIGRHVPDLAFLEVLLGDEPVLAPPVALYQRLLAGDQDEAGRIVDEVAKKTDTAGVFDDLLVPAIRLAEADRVRGVLSPEGETQVHELVGLFVEDTGVPAFTQPVGTRPVYCVPARDHADELAGRMLAKLLAASGVEAIAMTTDMLSGELVARINEGQPAAVCISAVPPRGALAARVLAKRLKTTFKDLPILVGVWDASAETEELRRGVGGGGQVHVMGTLRAVADQARTMAATITVVAGAGAGVLRR
jgi:predicted PurR-regulated permease PerM